MNTGTCSLCACDVYREREYAYMVHNDVWRAAIRRGQRHGLPVKARDLLCVGCFERCLGRQMHRGDLPPNLPINGAIGETRYGRSPRLNARREALA